VWLRRLCAHQLELALRIVTREALEQRDRQQPFGIDSGDRITAGVGEHVNAASDSDWVTVAVSSDRRIEVAEGVVVCWSNPLRRTDARFLQRVRLVRVVRDRNASAGKS
jgi:hypothetical protein